MQRNIYDESEFTELERMRKVWGRVERSRALIEQRLLVDNADQLDGSFPLFRKFPPEIRDRVWELAIPQRRLRPWHPWEFYEMKYRGYVVEGSFRGLPAPTVAHVCREARAVARRRGRTFRLYCRGLHNDLHVQTWFDGSRDVLELSTWTMQENRFTKELEMQGIMDLVKEADTILVQATHLDPMRSLPWIYRVFTEEAQGRSPKTINVQPLRTETTLLGQWNWQAMVKAFGNDTVAMVNLERQEEVERARAISASNPYDQCESFDVCLVQLMINESTRERCLARRDAIYLLKHAWVYGRMGDARSQIADVYQDIDIASPGALELLKSMPKIQFVYTLDRSNAPHVVNDYGLPKHPVHKVRDDFTFDFDSEDSDFEFWMDVDDEIDEEMAMALTTE